MQNKQIAERIKLRCRARSVAIKTVLRECEINHSFLYDMEHKDRSPSCDKIVRLADYLDCSTDYLLGRTDNPKINK